MDELRLALRRLARRPASTLVSVATLACAIGAAAVTWSALSALLLNPLPVKDAETLVVPGWRVAGAREAGRVETGFVYPVSERIRDARIFADTAPHWTPFPLLVGGPSGPANASVGFVGHRFFDLLGIPVAAGRGFAESEDRRGAVPVAVLTDHYWRDALAADPSAIGRTIPIAGNPVTVVGVLSPPFRGINLAEPVDLYLPFHTIGDVGSSGVNYFADPGTGYSPTSGTTIVARLRTARGDSEAISRLRSALPREWMAKNLEAALVPLSIHAIPERARPGMRQFSRLLAVTVGLLLLIGCSAVGMMLLIRTESRRQELGICVALGASRLRLACGIVIEAGFVSTTGAALAIPVNAWLAGILQTFELPGGVAIASLNMSIDGKDVLIAGLGALFAVVLAGGIASSFALRASAADARDPRSGVTPRNRRGLGTLLVAAQVAVALGLVAGAGVFARSLAAALSLNGGEDMTRIVSTHVNLGPHGYSAQTARGFFGELRARLARNPAVDVLTISRDLGGMGAGGVIPVDGTPRRFASTMWDIAIDSSYLRAMGLRLISGREFTDAEFSGGQPVAVVSESFARAIGEGESVLGTRLPLVTGRTDVPQDGRVIVGVVSDVITNLAMLEPLTTYVPVPPDSPSVRMQVVIRTSQDAAAAKRELARAIRQIDPSVIPGPILSLDERIARQMAPQRFAITVLAALGAIAVLLTLVGSYVVAEALATARMREMGIRAALGAQRRQLASIVLGETTRLVVVGIAAGLLLSWLGANTIRSFLFQVQPLDPVTLGTVAAAILLLALIVSLRAALRAARVDLSSVMKAE